MNNNKNCMLLPHLFETLSQKPEYCDTYENLCQEMEYIFSTQNLKQHYGNVEQALDKALNVGKSLGIITLTDDIVRMPFNFNKAAIVPSTAKQDVQKAALSPTKASEYFTLQTRRKHTVRPNRLPHDRHGRSSKGRRRRSGSSRRRRNGSSRHRRVSTRRSRSRRR